MAKSWIVNSGSAATVDGATNYLSIAGNVNNSSTEVDREFPIRDAGTFSKLFVRVSTNTTTTVTSTVTLRKSQADTSVVASITAGATGIFEDTSNTASFANTDEADYEVTVPSDGGGKSVTIQITGINFEPSASGCVSFLGSSGNQSTASPSTTRVILPTGAIGDVSTANEAYTKYRVRGSFTSSDFYIYVLTNARTTDTTFGTRKNGVNGNQSVTFTAGQTGAMEDTSNTDSLVAGDDFNYRVTTGTGTEDLFFRVISSTLTNSTVYFPMLVGNSSQGSPTSITGGTTVYAPPSGRLLAAPSSTESASQIYPRFDFRATELGVYVSENTTDSNSNITLRDNGADGTLTVTYASLQTGLMSDSVNSDIISSGTDEIDYKIQAGANDSLVVRWVGILGDTSSISETETKGLSYAVAPSVLKTLNYEVSPVSTKSLDYEVVTSTTATKSLDYEITTTTTDSKDLDYSVAPEQTKGLDYEVAPEITKGLTYQVVGTKQLDLDYQVETTDSETKGLDYEIAPEVSKGLDYAVTLTQQKTLEYAVAPEKTKALDYEVATTDTKTKTLLYGVTSPTNVMKGLTYKVKTPQTKTKGLTYRIRTTQTKTKGLSYKVRTTQTKSKALAYKVRPSFTQTKGLAYRVPTTQTQSKDLDYAITLTKTKGLQYEVAPVIGLPLRYMLPGEPMPLVNPVLDVRVVRPSVSA